MKKKPVFLKKMKKYPPPHLNVEPSVLIMSSAIINNTVRGMEGEEVQKKSQIRCFVTDASSLEAFAQGFRMT